MNTISTVGNVTAEIKHSASNGKKAVARFRIAENRRVRNDAGDWTDAEPIFRNVVVFGGQADNVAATFRKGHRVLVVGREQATTWLDRDTGEKRTGSEIVADVVGTSAEFDIWTRVED